MRYMGSKNRIAKFVLPIMIKEANEKGITTQMPIVNKILKEIIKLVDSRYNIFVGIYAADKWYTPGRTKVKDEILHSAKSMYLDNKIMDYADMEKMIIDNGYEIITKDF